MTGRKINPALLAGALAVTAGCAGAAGSAPPSGNTAALRAALDDEYRAEATYAAVITAFGEVRPFINIIEAERRHAAQAKAEMDRLGIAYPSANPYLGTLTAPASVLAACEQGITAEIENIALYDRILPTIEDPQVRETLTRLQWASRERHLPAFRRCVDRGGEMGRGPGRGGGRGGGRSGSN
jgi:rubrerythrin